MKKFAIALLVVATVGWYAQTADAAPHRGHRSSGHHGGHHGGHHNSHHGRHHGYHRSHSYHGGHHHGHGYYHRPHYRPYVPHYYAPAPYNGIELYGERGGFSLFW